MPQKHYEKKIRPNQKLYKHICRENDEPGYVLDKKMFVLIKKKTMTKAVKKVSEKIKKCAKDIRKGWGSSIDKLYIGKTPISAARHDGFDARNPETWTLDGGIHKHYDDHLKDDFGRNGLIVVAVVTKESIPRKCKRDGYITHHEEYALILKKCLIEKLKEDGKLAAKLVNRPRYPGRLDQRESAGYAIYITFSMKSKKC